MRRRTLLSAAATVGAGLLAGCTGTGPGGAPAGTTTADRTTTATSASTTTTGGTTTGPGGPFRFDPASDDPFEEIAVGSRENVLLPDGNRPHGVAVWNATDAERDIRLVVTDGGEAVLDRIVAFPADEFLAVELLEPGNYELALAAAGEPLGTLTVGTGWFDCNDSGTNVGVFEGRIEHVSYSTAAACLGPSVADHTFEVTGTGCGERNDGSLAVEGKTVTLAGHLRTPDPCHGAALAADTDREADAVTLVVSPTDSDGMCQQCVGEAAYEGAVTFEEEVPDEVVLVHERGDGRTEVARL